MISRWKWLFSLIFTLTMLTSLAMGQELAIKQAYHGTLTGENLEEGNMTFTIQNVEEAEAPMRLITLNLEYHLKVINGDIITTIDGEGNLTFSQFDEPKAPLRKIKSDVGSFVFEITAKTKNEGRNTKCTPIGD